MTRKFWTWLLASIALIFLALIRIPVGATVLVPMQFGDHVGKLLRDEGIPVVRDRFESFNCSYHRSIPCFGWQIWLSQSALMADATDNKYYCETTYTPALKWFSWKRSTGNSRMIGLQ